MQADPAFDVDTHDLFILADAVECSNNFPIASNFSEGWIDCGTWYRNHEDISTVSAEVHCLGNLRCERHVESEPMRTVFACDWD